LQSQILLGSILSIYCYFFRLLFCSVHVVFGRVIFGQAIVKQIEGLPVDRKSRPLQDVRIADSGELVLVKKKKKGLFEPIFKV